MLYGPTVILSKFKSAKITCRAFLVVLCLLMTQVSLYGANVSSNKTFTYQLSVNEFVSSFIEIPTSTITAPTTTTSSKYLAGRAYIYDEHNQRVGNCSASFLCIKNSDNIIYNDISNYLSTDSGLIVSWFTPTTLANLELDTIVNSMVTECLVTVNTKIGASIFYGQNYELVVSSDGSTIYFQFTRIGNIF